MYSGVRSRMSSTDAVGEVLDGFWDVDAYASPCTLHRVCFDLVRKAQNIHHKRICSFAGNVLSMLAP